MIPKEIWASQYSANRDNKENHSAANLDKLTSTGNFKSLEEMQSERINENFAVSNSKWIEVASESEYEKEFSSMLNNDNLHTTERRGNRFRRSIKEDDVELSPVVKLIHSPDSHSEYGGTIDIPISIGFAKIEETHLMTNFELEEVQTQSKEICQIHYKKIEAFCNEWKDTLWIDWILGDNHKQHNFEGIDKAALKQKELMETNYSKVMSTKKTLEKMEGRIDKFLKDLDERIDNNATLEWSKIIILHNNAKSIEEVFDLVVATITKKKQDWIQNMKDAKDKEEKMLTDKKSKIIAHIDSINKYLNIKDNLLSMSDLDILEGMNFVIYFVEYF